MASIFTVQCPACRQNFPCHTELWQAGYDLLCPFCQASFPQEESPRIVSATGEVREATGEVREATGEVREATGEVREADTGSAEGM